MLKIERSVEGGRVRLALSGDLDGGGHLAELERVLAEETAPRDAITLDLGEVRLVDREAVGFLGRCDAAGVRLERCPAYVREWIARERNGRIE